jgi:hypothetical protein
MSIQKEKCPTWAGKALQGLTFWVGHRQALYSGYLLSEGALVAETCNLIYANLSSEESLHCEVPYGALTLTSKDSTIARKTRIDLVVAAKKIGPTEPKDGDLQTLATAAVEIKRASASRKEIDQDIERLAKLKVENPNIRTFLFLVSENKRPSRFVSKKGRAVKGDFAIAGSTCYYSVRRACKAALSFSGHDSSHYACIIEIFDHAS